MTFLVETGSHDFHSLRFGSHRPRLWKSNCAHGSMHTVLKILLYLFRHDVVCNAYLLWFLCLFLNMLMFNCLLNNVKAETNGKKHSLYTAILFLFLMCPSDHYSMIQSLQTGMSKHIGPRSDYPNRAVPWILKISA